MEKSFKRQLTVSMGIILGTFAVSAAALYLLSSDLSAHADKVISDKAFVAGQTEILGSLAALKSGAAQSAPYADAMKKLLPTHDALIGFPQWIVSVGHAHNVSVSFTFTGQNTGATDLSPGTDGFSLSASGSAADLVAFLDGLEMTGPGFLLAINAFDLTNNGSAYQLSAQGNLFSR